MTNVPGLVSAEEYENLQFALILMHHYQLSDFINKYSSVRSGIDHLDRTHFAKLHLKELFEFNWENCKSGSQPYNSLSHLINKLFKSTHLIYKWSYIDQVTN